MMDEPENANVQISEDRRAFLEKARKTVLAAPAAALLLAATAKATPAAVSGQLQQTF